MKLKYVLLTIVSLGLLGMLLIPAPVAVTAADNLAANGDLELGNTNGWEVANGALDTATVYSGSYSLKLTATSAYSGAAYKTIPVRKNATITVSFYYRYASDPGSKLYHVFTYQGADTNVGPYSNADKSFAKPSGCNSISTWQQVSYTFNCGNYTAITLKFCPSGSGGTPCYIDDLVVTSEGGDITEEAPYLTSFGTKMGRPKDAASNLIQQGGFETITNAPWNTSAFLSDRLQVVEDPTAPEGNHSLCFDSSDVNTAAWHSFAVSVEPYTQYTFSAWVKSPRLSENNRATATFGVANAATGKFLVYEPYNGNGYGAASISTETMQLMATSPDDAWHLRSVTFYSGTHTTVNIAVYGAESQLYLDDIALFKSSNGVEYLSPLRTETLTAGNNSGNKYCADEDSLIAGIDMTTNDARLSWSDNPAWRNGFLSFADVGDSHGAVLKYTASAHTERQLHYIDWIDVTPNTSYTLTLDVKRQVAGGGRIALLDDDYDAPKEFYTISFSATDSDWVTYSVTFHSGAYSRVGFAIVDGGGSALLDEVRLFETAKGVADKPTDPIPTLYPEVIGTSVMETSGDKLGVGFLIRQQGYRIYMDSRHLVELSTATVVPYANGEAYPLLRMGAVMTNQTAIGEDSSAMTLAAVNNDTVVDVPAVYVRDVSETDCEYAVRVKNVPSTHRDTLIYARPYYVFEKDGEEIVVYGEIVYRSYNG
ncbi:MAG: carbohydrate binding domain-containing protein [Clostridia bacterium]|nr:carbohydrate binding domain-containing protein [Clostridia bacterium]